MTSKLALFALFYWFFLFLTCFLGGKLGLYHKIDVLRILCYNRAIKKGCDHMAKETKTMRNMFHLSFPSLPVKR